ncbi:hypothetical protein EV356DRAFT_65226 [Viridothelium virens]|uniref:Ubiquitin-like domain-containing protein n=1 Tax=Viridothelium virens TaxID=1048519 RepID=A0A6A6HF30_VIRVR|nr:hypothetical protein EV356DRAFT_65226 [Viridothelium virens]
MEDSSIQLIVRFATSTPDLPLLIASPQSTSTLSLKQVIRTHLPPPASSNRLRLIYAGKVLPDTALLSSALHIPPPPPRSDSDAPIDSRPGPDSYGGEKTTKSKGKEPIRDSNHTDSRNLESTRAISRIYIHCSVGDALSPAELEAEAHAALSSTHSPRQPPVSTSQQKPSTSHVTIPSPSLPHAETQLLGFDRLLSANFTREDVASLRAQFLALQQYTHTPDTMPHGNALRLLEERWLDSEAFGPPTGGNNEHQSGNRGDESGGPTTVMEGGGITGADNTRGGGGGWGVGVSSGFGEDSGLEDMLIGNLMGFFWPLGALCWLLREEGVWTQRRQIAVFTGMVVNAAFGFWRMAG